MLFHTFPSWKVVYAHSQLHSTASSLDLAVRSAQAEALGAFGYATFLFNLSGLYFRLAKQPPPKWCPAHAS
jgi:hypothetical protein